MSQGNATSGVGVRKPDVAHDVYDVLVNEEPIAGVIQQTERENFRHCTGNDSISRSRN